MKIYAIQGAGHRSPFEGQEVSTRGVVTAIGKDGFYVQDPVGDGDDSTSDGIYVWTETPPMVRPGDAVEVTGTVTEYTRPKHRQDELPSTQIRGKTSVRVLSRGNPLPVATRLGRGGREIPRDDLKRAMDLYESVEHMRVEVENAVVVGATHRDDFTALADNGVYAGTRTDRGGLVYNPMTGNPNRVAVSVDRETLPDFTPYANVGDKVGNIVGVMAYKAGLYNVEATERFEVESSHLEPTVTKLVGTPTQLTVASYNVENLDPKVEEDLKVDKGYNRDDDIGSGKYAAIAGHIVKNLCAPDIIGLQEIQDNDGTENTDVVAADRTLQVLIDAIAEAGGPRYGFVDVPPTPGKDGGQPGANIRNAYLYRLDRVRVVPGSEERIGADDDSDDAVFARCRKSLAVTFQFGDERVSVINNHLSSPNGSTPLFGAIQPRRVRNVERRLAQGVAVNTYVATLLARDPDANLVLLGDFNATEHSPALKALAGDILVNLTETIPESQRHTINYRGQAQAFDHVLVNKRHRARVEFEPVHVNAEFHAGNSDHDPVIARLSFAKENDDAVG